jgi:restriction system protein
MLLDDMNGFEFEEFVADLFRKLGYKRVKVTQRTGDSGRDITMEEAAEGERVHIVVECKHHKQQIGRPVIQKLHSATLTLSKRGNKKGFVVTSGFFSGNAKKYADYVNATSNKLVLCLMDGRELKKLAKSVGVNFSSGTIQVISNESFPYSDLETNYGRCLSFFEGVIGFKKELLKIKNAELKFLPAVYLFYEINSSFSTTVGQIHSIDKKESALYNVLLSSKMANGFIDRRDLLFENCREIAPVENVVIEKIEFDRNQREIREEIMRYLISQNTVTVGYYGRNNVRYNKECVPRRSDVTIDEFRPIYLPHYGLEVSVIENVYSFNFADFEKEFEVINETTHVCKACNASTKKFLSSKRWLCCLCGRILCYSCKTLDRLTQEPLCKECAIEEKFMWAKKYFKNKQNLEKFTEQFEAMPIYQKILENKWLTAGLSAGIIAVLLGSLMLVMV